MVELRLLADDITGALDSAAAFAPALGPIRTIWQDGTAAAAGSLAIDTGTREANARTAAAKVRAFAPFLAPTDGRLSFFKVDSLLRGNAGAELAAILAVLPFDVVVIAPAIPFQARCTRSGRQMRLDAGAWVATGEDIAATLRDAGHAVRLCRAGDALPRGITIWDADTDADLDQIVAACADARSILYVGAAGLTGALARMLARSAGQRLREPAAPSLPLLGLIGTDHKAMLAQLDKVSAGHVRIGCDVDAAIAELDSRLNISGVAFATCVLPMMPREAARTEIAARFAALCRRAQRPAALFVSGGETLAALCRDLGATALDVTGQFETGLPYSVMRGGMWDGLSIISKSGAFGSPDILSRLVRALTPKTSKVIA